MLAMNSVDQRLSLPPDTPVVVQSKIYQSNPSEPRLATLKYRYTQIEKLKNELWYLGWHPL